MKSITTQLRKSIESARRNQLNTAVKQYISDVANAASQLQRQVPGLSRTEALRIAERQFGGQP